MAIFLEQWVHDQIKHRLRQYNKKLGYNDIKEYQILKLRDMLNYVYGRSSFYRELFDRYRLKPSKIQEWNDLQLIPFTTSSDLRENPYRLLCVPLAEVDRIYTLFTGGTTGVSKKVFFTARDLEQCTEYMGAAMHTVAMMSRAANRYKVAMLLPDSAPASQAKLLSEGVERYGGIPIKLDLSLDGKSQLEVIREIKPDILFGSVPRLWRFTQETRQVYDLSKVGLKVLFLSSGYLSEGARTELKRAWQCDVYCHYGMTEMGFGGPIECRLHKGFHINEADFLFEIVYPATGQNVEPGREGELVFTTLSREGMPLIRYRTGDLTKFISEPCRCGASTLQRLGEVTKRVDSVVRIGRGNEVFPSMFDDVLYTIREVIDYEVAVSRGMNKDILTFEVEVHKERIDLQKELAAKLLQIPAIKKEAEANAVAVKVNFVHQGELKRQGRAKRLIVDTR